MVPATTKREKMAAFNEMNEALVSCDTDKLIQLVNTAIADNVSASDIPNHGLIAGMDIVESGLRDQVKILVGGVPDQAFADEIGADGFAPDAGSVSKLAKTM